MKGFTPEQVAQHALSDASERTSRLSEQLMQAERRLGQNINRNRSNPHPLWQNAIAGAKREVVRLRAELTSARKVYQELRDETMPLENAA